MARLFLVSVVMSAAALLGACFDKPAPACAFWCGVQNACPDGYRCAADLWCKREDVPETHECGPGPLDDAGTPDPGDAGPTDAAPVTDAAQPDAIGGGLR